MSTEKVVKNAATVTKNPEKNFVENYAQNYNIENLNSCNPELQLKNNQSMNKNKLKILKIQ